jgi:hypothetical protein
MRIESTAAVFEQFVTPRYANGISRDIRHIALQSFFACAKRAV